MCIKGLFGFSGLLFLSLFCASIMFSNGAKADTFTSAEFLTWKEDSQDFFIEASVGMAGFIASQIDSEKKQAKCIGEWYYPKEAEKNDFIKNVMRENSGYHPRAIILGVLEKQCGEF